MPRDDHREGDDRLPQQNHPRTRIHKSSLQFNPKLYIIAVGGAGSSGLPALASGTRTITNPRITSTMKPDTTLGCAKITGSGHCLYLNTAMTMPMSASPAMNPEAVSTPAFS